MDFDTFSDLGVITNKNTNDLLYTSSNITKSMDDDLKTEALTTKIAIKFLLEGKLKSKICRYCLNITQGLTELDQIMNIAGTGHLYKVTVRDIVASFHPFKVIEDPNFPNKICQKCIDRALAAYLFMQQCERAERAMLNCFEDVYEKFERLDPIDRPKKRGRQKLNPNYNKLYVEHKKVIDYAEPIINIVNVRAESFTTEPVLNALECKKCWQVLPNIESLLNHEKIHPKTMWYHCRLCGKSFPKCNQLKKHHDRVHILGKELQSHKYSTFKCRECNHITENYVLHLQHIEKHKFKKVMKHLIEKRMDRLCTVCFNKSDKMVDLDNMVCLHGGHPDLMGDKTLQSILASTLPNIISAKYQELYIPTNAQIMTIKKRKCNDDCNVKEIKSHPFIFSHPLLLSECTINNESTYFYSFSNPIKLTIEVSHIFNTDKEKADNLHTDIIDIEVPKTIEIEIDTDNKLLTSTIHTDLINNTVIQVDHDSAENTCNKSHKGCDVKLINSCAVNAFTDDKNPTLTDGYECWQTNTDKIEKKEEINSKCVSFSDTNINTHREINKSEASDIYVYNKNNETRKKSVIDVTWLFKNILDHEVTKEEPFGIPSTIKSFESKSDCKYCWVFKNMLTCDFCNKSTEKINDNYDTVSKVNDKCINIMENPKVAAVNNIWVCNICLTNNKTNRQACNCCETPRVLESNDVRFNFDNNNIFTQQTEKITETLKDIDPCLEKPIFNEIAIKECQLMNIQAVSKENTEILSMDVEISNTDNMETNEFNQSKNYTEYMDIEEITLLPIKEFNMPPIVDFNSNNNANGFLSVPNMAALHFNIGLSDTNKSTMRKFKKGRNMSRISHNK